MNYILRTEKDGMLDSILMLFTDNMEETRLSAEEHLTAYLRHLILLNHYSGLGPLIKAFWRWNDDDTVDELELKYWTEVPEADGIEQYYRVYVESTKEEVTRFTVRI